MASTADGVASSSATCPWRIAVWAELSSPSVCPADNYRDKAEKSGQKRNGRIYFFIRVFHVVLVVGFAQASAAELLKLND